MIRNTFGIEIPRDMLKDYERHETRGRLKHWNYCKLDKLGQPEEVMCKTCNAKIVGIRAWGDPQVRESADEQRTLVVTQHVRVMPFDNYSMVLLEMNDGSKHLTPVCRRCEKKIRQASPELLHDIYMSDLKSLADTALQTRDMEVVQKLHKRKPVKVL